MSLRTPTEKQVKRILKGVGGTPESREKALASLVQLIRNEKIFTMTRVVEFMSHDIEWDSEPQRVEGVTRYVEGFLNNWKHKLDL